MDYMFLVKGTNEVIIPVSVSINNGSFDTLVGHTLSDVTDREFVKGTYICLDESINVPGVGVLRDGDKIKLTLFDKTFYTLHFGWYTTNDGLDLYGWYLVNNERVQSFFKRYIDTLEVVEFCGKCPHH